MTELAPGAFFFFHNAAHLEGHQVAITLEQTFFGQVIPVLDR